MATAEPTHSPTLLHRLFASWLTQDPASVDIRRTSGSLKFVIGSGFWTVRDLVQIARTLFLNWKVDCHQVLDEVLNSGLSIVEADRVYGSPLARYHYGHGSRHRLIDGRVVMAVRVLIEGETDQHFDDWYPNARLFEGGFSLMEENVVHPLLEQLTTSCWTWGCVTGQRRILRHLTRLNVSCSQSVVPQINIERRVVPKLNRLEVGGPTQFGHGHITVSTNFAYLDYLRIEGSVTVQSLSITIQSLSVLRCTTVQLVGFNPPSDHGFSPAVLKTPRDDWSHSLSDPEYRRAIKQARELGHPKLYATRLITDTLGWQMWSTSYDHLYRLEQLDLELEIDPFDSTPIKFSRVLIHLKKLVLRTRPTIRPYRAVTDLPPSLETLTVIGEVNPLNIEDWSTMTHLRRLEMPWSPRVVPIFQGRVVLGERPLEHYRLVSDLSRRLTECYHLETVVCHLHLLPNQFEDRPGYDDWLSHELNRVTLQLPDSVWAHPETEIDDRLRPHRSRTMAGPGSGLSSTSTVGAGRFCSRNETPAWR